MYQYVSLEGHLEIFWGKTLPQLLEKWFPLQGERAHSQTPISIPNQIQSIYCSSFFLCLQGQPELRGSYHLLQSCVLSSSVSMASRCLAFLFPSVSMVNLNRLVAASFSSLTLLSSSVSTANLGCLLATTFSSLSFLSN